jgi:hypothetical protein
MPQVPIPQEDSSDSDISVVEQLVGESSNSDSNLDPISDVIHEHSRLLAGSH